MTNRVSSGKLCFGGAVLASLALTGATQAQVKVAVVYGGQATGSQCAAQLNDDTYFDFDAVAIGAADADSLAELQQYNCVILGDAGYRDNGYTAQMFAAMRQYLDAGGGIVTVGWYNYCTDTYSGQQALDADYITPIADGPYNFQGSGGTCNTTGGHPITDGIGNYNYTANFHEYALAVDSGATSLGEIAGVSGSVAIAYQDSVGRSCYVGGLYLASTSYNTSGLRSGIEDQLLEQAVQWAGGGPGCLEMTVSSLVAGQQASWDVAGGTPGERIVIVYGFRDGQTVVNGIGGYCATFGIQGVNQSKIICQKTANGSGEISCNKTIPSGTTGRRVLTQASERGTCPNECMSSVDDQVVG